MRNVIKQILVAVLLLLLSSNSLFANNNSHSLFENTVKKDKASVLLATHLSEHDFNFYSSNLPNQDEFIKKGVISDNDEEDVEQLSCKKIEPQTKSVVCHFKQQLILDFSLSQNSTFNYATIFFHSKTATSLYLLFEDFRI